MNLIAIGGRGEDRVCHGEICTLNYKKDKNYKWCAYDGAQIKEIKKPNGEKNCRRCSQEQIILRK